MIGSALTKIFGSKNERTLKEIQPIVNKINNFEPEIQKLSDAELAAKTVEFKERFTNGESLDDSSFFAAVIIFSPPRACTFNIQTPRSAAAAQAFATVFGMSWYFRSRKTSKFLSTSCLTSDGPQRVKSSLPTLRRHREGSSWSISCMVSCSEG